MRSAAEVARSGPARATDLASATCLDFERHHVTEDAFVQNSSHSPGGTGDIFPAITLPSNGTAPISIDSYRPRYDLIVAMLGAHMTDPMRRLLDELLKGRADVEAEDGRVIAVLADARGLDDWAWPFPLLYDDRGGLHRSVGALDDSGRPAPALYFTDRYREIYGRTTPGEAGWPTSAADVIQWLTFMNIQCPECNVPEW